MFLFVVYVDANNTSNSAIGHRQNPKIRKTKQRKIYHTCVKTTQDDSNMLRVILFLTFFIIKLMCNTLGINH